jgi:hypothetical protein
VGPERVVVASLYNRTVLVCQAEGNPQPAYQWLQKTSTAEETVYVRGAEPMLVIHNVTYEYQGKYYCKASNVISGTDRTIQSDPIDLSVMGTLVAYLLYFLASIYAVFFVLLLTRDSQNS